MLMLFSHIDLFIDIKVPRKTFRKVFSCQHHMCY